MVFGGYSIIVPGVTVVMWRDWVVCLVSFIMAIGVMNILDGVLDREEDVSFDKVK